MRYRHTTTSHACLLLQFSNENKNSIKLYTIQNELIYVTFADIVN